MAASSVTLPQLSLNLTLALYLQLCGLTPSEKSLQLTWCSWQGVTIQLPRNPCWKTTPIRDHPSFKSMSIQAFYFTFPRTKEHLSFKTTFVWFLGWSLEDRFHCSMTSPEAGENLWLHLSSYITAMVCKNYLCPNCAIFMFWWICYEIDLASPLVLSFFLCHAQKCV